MLLPLEGTERMSEIKRVTATPTKKREKEKAHESLM
jgi:hypothetical protein